MTTQQFLTKTTQKLKDAGITTARLDCLVLLEDALGIDRANILAHPEQEISPVLMVALNTKVTQRLQHVPLAYIRGRAPFYGRDFSVSKAVLVPRPETESLIELLKTIDLPRPVRIVDIGTGSGCIGITAALEIPDALVFASDIDPQALKTAQANAASLHARVQFCEADLLRGLPPEHFEVIITNLPYVPIDYPVNQAARHEPKRALYAGRDGMDLYRVFWKQIAELPSPPRFVITESLTEQHKQNSQLAKTAGYVTEKISGLGQLFHKTT